MIFKSIRKRLKVFSILSSLIILLPIQPESIACSDSTSEEEIRYMLFNPDLAENKNWWTFFYNYKFTYLDGSMQSSDDDTKLVQEWINELNLKSGQEAADLALFGSLPDSALQDNPFFKEIQKNPSAREYFSLARLSESASGYYDPWDDTPEIETQQSNIRNTVIEAAIRSFNAEKNPFFKKKYAFQLIKMAYYQHDKTLFNRYYHSWFDGENKSVLDWWAMHYKAELLDEVGNVDSANYLHAKVFSGASAKMNVSRQHFSKKNLDAVLALAENAEDRADVLLLSEVINPGRSLMGITEIYQLNPTHRHLPLLISREINKLESWLGAKYVELPGYDGKMYSPELLLPGDGPVTDAAYLQQFTAALQQMPALEQQQSEVYALSMAYLGLLGNNVVLAETYLNKVSGAENYQKQILEVVLLTKKEGIKTPQAQEALGKKLASLIEGREQKFESQKILFSLFSYLRYEFARNGLVAQAGLFDNYANNKFCSSCGYGSLEYEQISYFDKFASAADVKQVVDLCLKKDKSTLDVLLSKPYTNINYLYDLLAVKYLREGDLTHAGEVLQQVPDEFWYSFANANQNLDRDPFLENDELLSPGSMNTYTKRQVIERMIALEQEAERMPQKRAEIYYQLANAWYNFTDNAWFMIDYSWSSQDSDRTDNNRLPRKRALALYKKAVTVESDPEQKARLFYMIVLLSRYEDQKEFAIEYERLQTTNFYKKRNCLTTADLVQE